MRTPILAPSGRTTRFLLAVVVVLGFALRLPAPDLPPPGLYRDEAYNGLDAAGILAGDLRLYYPANNGREPAFLYLASAFVAALGRSPAALRLASAFVGTATVAAAFAAGAALAGRRAGLLTAALMAVAPWPVILSRVGLRAGLLPLVLALAVAATARGRREGSTRFVALGGALSGLTLYTYVAAWAGFGAVALFALWWLARRRRIDRRTVAVWAAAAVVVPLPLVAAYALDPAAALGRATQVAAVGPEAPAEVDLIANAARAAGLFVWRGDPIARHNVPLRPLLAPLGAAVWLAGLAVLAFRARRSARAAAVLVWLAAWLAPTVLATDAPHFLRAAGLLPAAFVPAALGALWLGGVPRRVPGLARFAGPATLAVALVVVGAELAATVRYRSVGRSGALGERLWYDFESGAVALAADVNDRLGTGWRGGWSVTRDGGSEARQAVWLDRRLRDGWAAVPYLVPTDRLTLTDPYDPILTTGAGTAYLWPHGLDLPNVWSDRPAGLRLAARPGSLERGDLEAEPRLLYLAVEATEAEPVAEPLAAFANGLHLVAAGAAPEGDRLVVTTEWSIDEPRQGEVTAFVQVLEDGVRLAGSDAPLGAGWLPTEYWLPGDRVVERRDLDVPGGFDPGRHRVVVGLYEWPDLTPIRAELPDGRVVERVEIASGP